MPLLRKTTFLTSLLFLLLLPSAQGQKPPLTLDEFFDAVAIRAVQISPDGHGVVIATVRADWAANRFRNDLWLYDDREGGRLIQLTQSGHDSGPQWAPDGRWVAFLSDRKPPASEAKGRDDGDADKEGEPVAQVYVISATGGEAFPATFGDEEVHAFAWSGDSRAIYFATREPWTKEQKDAYRKEWNDVVRFREAERGDNIFVSDVAAIAARATIAAAQAGKLPAPKKLAATADRVQQLVVSPDGNHLAFATEPRSQRQEDSLEPYAIYDVDLPDGNPRVVCHTQGMYDKIAWAPDSRHIFLTVSTGSVEGPYQDAQRRVYWADAAASSPNAVARWAAEFTGSVEDYSVLPGKGLLAVGNWGTEMQPYIQSDPSAPFALRHGRPGWYEFPSAALRSPRVGFVYSSLQDPSEVYIAESPDDLERAKPVTAFNRLFAERELPRGKPYHWTADDGTTVEGMLIYPPGKFETNHLPMFVSIHCGYGEPDGNHFEADWWQWAALAATEGWLVFEPNCRGTWGYGDAFALGIVPHYVSRPGKDILEGVDALVKDGIADPDRLTVGGYSSGGMMTNWLITQTTRFKAAVTGAGPVEYVAVWGNSEWSFDWAYLLGGVPWEAEANYNAEAALWQIGKVTTPTHIVCGSEDINVYVGDDYLLERALHTRGIPSTLLIFPGEGHGLHKNPWHGKIKVREELKWLERYGRKK